MGVWVGVSGDARMWNNSSDGVVVLVDAGCNDRRM